MPIDVRHLRLRLKLSQTALAAELGVSRWTIIRWEKGRHQPHVIFAEKLVKLKDACDAAYGPEPTPKRIDQRCAGEQSVGRP